jgi:hypothetical protein
MLPRVGCVRVEAAHDRVIVTEEITLPRGDWQSGGVDVFVAFGAPGTPVAFDAHLVPPGGGDAAAPADEEGEAVSAEPAVRRDGAAQVLVGPPRMAGMLVRVKEAQLRRAFARGDATTLRLRSLLLPPATAQDGARDVVVRVGTAEGAPLTIERIELRPLDARGRTIRAEASLCGAEADAWPLTVNVATTGRRPGAPPPASPKPTIAPELAVRHASDDLCIRWWTAH